MEIKTAKITTKAAQISMDILVDNFNFCIVATPLLCEKFLFEIYSTGTYLRAKVHFAKIETRKNKVRIFYLVNLYLIITQKIVKVHYFSNDFLFILNNTFLQIKIVIASLQKVRLIAIYRKSHCPPKKGEHEKTGNAANFRDASGCFLFCVYITVQRIFGYSEKFAHLVAALCNKESPRIV